jgi:hypothetical protein
MASTSLMTYLSYMSTWDTESDANINEIIAEQYLFLQVGDFDYETAVNTEFQTLNNLAISVRDQTIAADAVQIAADVAAVASIWSFGLGMAAFATLEASEIIERRFISSKSAELNNKLTTVDTDISSKISENVKNYITKFKSNNNLIKSKAPVGLDTKTCRSILLHFTSEVYRKTGKLDPATFKTYAESARLLYRSSEIQKVYDALDELNLSEKNEADVRKYMNVIVGFQLPTGVKLAKNIVMGISILIMFRNLKIANNVIKAEAEAAAEAAGEAGMPVEEFVSRSAFDAMGAIGKGATIIAVMSSVLDIFFNILDIVDVVQQSNAMCNELQGRIKQSYLDYFNGIKEASKQYKAAINPTLPNNTWIKNPNLAQFKEADWSNLKKTIPNTTVEAAKLYANSDPTINFFFYCRQNVTLEPHGTFFPGTAVFFAGKPWYGVTDRCDAYDKSSS